MYEFYLGEKKRTMKTSWYELTPEEFILISGFLNRYRKGDIALFDLRTLMTLVLIGVDTRRIRTGGHMDENIYHLSRELDFFFRIEYDDKKAFSAFSPEIRKQLIHKFPEDLEQIPEVRAAIKLKKHIRLNVEFGKNILLDIRFGRRHFPGYTFIITDGIAQTSLTALQFSEAQKVIAQYNHNESSQLLNLLCGILYQCGYSEEIAIDLAKQFSPVGHQVKEAVLLNFLAITNFIVHQTKYAILFDRPKKSTKERKYSLGLAENMYMLSKKGYGDSRQMENAGLFKFFDLLIKELADQAAELEAAGKKKGEIATAMNLTIEQLNDLL
jgi:hypothetical protein